MDNDYRSVTEIAGDDVSMEQISRLCNRYYWASEFCIGKDVAEVACGSGQGLGFLNDVSSSFVAGDYSPDIVQIAKKYYRNRITIEVFDAQKMPYRDNSKDVIIIFEAIYYLPDFEKFIIECKRVLRNNGLILIATANKDLFDFNPSPFSFVYYGVKELNDILCKHGFKPQFYGDTPITEVSFLQKIMRPVKKTAVDLNLLPKSMKAKKMLKRLIFGELVNMPAEIDKKTSKYIVPDVISTIQENVQYKVILCAAQL